MASLGKSLGSMFADTRNSAMLPPLPEGLGLPGKSQTRYIGRAKGEIADGPDSNYQKERPKAEAYNKAFAELLNNQPQLSGGERREIYEAYSDKFIAQGTLQSGKKIQRLTNYGATLSDSPAMTREQIAAAQQQAEPQEEAALPVPEPAPTPPPAPAPPPVPAVAVQPQTVGPVAAPQEPATPTTATASGNIAGQTATTGAPSGARGRRGRMQTLLTGLGGAVERFGL